MGMRIELVRIEHVLPSSQVTSKLPRGANPQRDRKDKAVGIKERSSSYASPVVDGQVAEKK
jgi:hypothetical protein